MTDSTPPAAEAPTPPSGLKAGLKAGLKVKATDLGMQVYLKAPPRAQNAMLQGFVKTQPVVAKVSPHAKKIVGGGLALLVLRKVRHRHR